MAYLSWFILTVLYGACVGSFLNVVIYRLPEGKSLWRPGSMCPRCGHKLAWYDNVPVLAWLWLRARCRYCRAPISAQYPLIEAVTAMLFGGLFLVFYESGWRPGFLASISVGFKETWPVFVVYLVLAAALLAATVIDARLYVIPLPIPLTATVVAAVLLPASAAALSPLPLAGLAVRAPYWGAVAGGMAGLAVALGLLALGLIPNAAAEEEPPPPVDDQKEPAGDDARHREARKEPAEAWSRDRRGAPADQPSRSRSGPVAAVALGFVVLTLLLVWAAVRAPDSVVWPVVAMGAILALWAAVMAIGLLSDDTMSSEDADDFVVITHARRMAAKELLFVGWPVVGALLGQMLLPSAALKTHIPSAWSEVVDVLAGVGAGYLVGGAAVWTTRILGTLVFGKEAMGLGDVHLLAAVGAVLGWEDALVVFFLAPFLGLVGAAVAYGIGRLAKGQVRVIPYGPYLGGAAIVVMVLHDKIHENLGF